MIECRTLANIGSYCRMTIETVLKRKLETLNNYVHTGMT